MDYLSYKCDIGFEVVVHFFVEVCSWFKSGHEVCEDNFQCVQQSHASLTATIHLREALHWFPLFIQMTSPPPLHTGDQVVVLQGGYSGHLRQPIHEDFQLKFAVKSEIFSIQLYRVINSVELNVLSLISLVMFPVSLWYWWRWLNRAICLCTGVRAGTF